MTTPAFIDHWRTGHADAASAIPGLRSYVQLHPVLLGGVHALGYPGFDACSELDFDSLEAMDAGFASEAYQGAVRDDEEAFIDKQRFSLVLAEREVLSGIRGDGGGVRLVTFLRRHPGVAAGQLLGAVTGPYAERAAAAVIGHEVLRAIDHDRPDRQQQAADVVDELVFSGVESALDWCGSEGATEAGLALAGLTAGTVRFLARSHVVV